MQKITEQSSNHQDLEKKSILEILEGINTEDRTVPLAIEKVIPNIEELVDALLKRVEKGGRLFLHRCWHQWSFRCC